MTRSGIPESTEGARSKMNAWVNQIFEADIVKRGGVVRRKIASIEKFASKKAVKDEVKRRGYHIVEHGDQWLIFCDPRTKYIV